MMGDVKISIVLAIWKPTTTPEILSCPFCYLCGMATKLQNRRKLLKRNCPHCKSVQDLFADDCRQCGQSMLVEGESEIRDRIAALVDDVEASVDELESGKALAGAYKQLDRAAKALRVLKTYDTLPGMNAYTDACKAILQPHRLQSLQSTLKGNLVMMGLLLIFPMVPILFGWKIQIIGLMLLPSLFWAGITFKAWRDLKRAKA